MHLTSIGSTRAQLSTIIHALLDRGVRGILALRGDQSEGHSLEDDEIPFARPLVELIRTIEHERTATLAGGRVSIGVAAYPHRHPESPTTSHDTEVLVAKERAGADFAISQVFFDASVYCGLLALGARGGDPDADRARPRARHQPAPPRAPRRDQRCRSAPRPPPPAGDRLRRGRATPHRRALHRRPRRWVLDAGAPGVHLYTFNSHGDALDVLDHLDLDRWSTTQGETR